MLRRLPALAAVLIGATLGVPVHAEPSWNASLGAEADDNSASASDVEIGWAPTDRFGISFAAGHASGADDLGTDFSSTTLFAGMDWRFTDLVGMALAYDVWDDPDTYEKRTTHATLYLGNERFRAGVLAQAVESTTTAELALLRRRTSISFDGTGFGAELVLNGERLSAYASYIGYDYEENVDRLLTFLSNPTLARRPRLEALLGSGLTAAAALLDYSAMAGADLYAGDARIGVSYSLLRDLVTDADSSSLRAELEWPLSDRWSARLVAGVNDSDIESSALFGGARILYRSR
jgi:hypothetical protein